jgi:4-hydroxybenzoate polyprenyltransferase
MTPGTKLHALLSTARIANVPSVVSNLACGVLLGSLATGSGFSWPWALTLAAILFYVGGNFLNDWADRDWDMEHRPERALPSGMFPAKMYYFIAASCCFIGLAISWWYGSLAFAVALILVGLISWYTKIHKKTAFSVIPMGMCRACLPLLGYVGVRGGISGTMLFPAAALLIYIIALSMSARGESRSDVQPAEQWQARGLLFLGGLIAAVLPFFIDPAIGWIGLLPFLLWLVLCITKYRSPVPAHVSALLAGIPLVDWITLLPMAFIWLRLERFEPSDPMFLTALLLPPICFIAGRALQRLAPAT